MKHFHFARSGTIVFFLLLLSFLFACHKEKEDPDKEFFECFLNGKRWRPCATLTFPPENKLYGFTEGDTRVYISALRHCMIEGVEVDDYFDLITDSTKIHEDYKINRARYGNIIGCRDYLTDSTYNNTYFKITRYESPFGFIAGEFGTRLISSDCKDTVTITDGKFQIRTKD